MNLNKIIILLAVTVTSLTAYALTDREQQVADRLAPVGVICMAGDPCSASGAAIAGGPKDPEQVYNTYCMACHLTGASDAPILGNIEAWAPRIAKGTEVLYQNAINGLNVMPAKGLCMDCSDEDVMAVVDYIAERSQ